MPKRSPELAPTSSELLGITDIYGFLIARSLITMGTLGDRIGRRRLLLIGAAAFGAASVLAAFLASPEMLIAARALLGLAIGVLVASFSGGTAVGPLLGGALLEQFWWGSMFLLNVPVMALLRVAGPRLLPEFRAGQEPSADSDGEGAPTSDTSPDRGDAVTPPSQPSERRSGAL